jgi:hypothetical protein
MDPSRADYYLLWKGRQAGPFSLAAIREKLVSGEINRMHQVSVDGRWVVLGDFLEQQEGGPAEVRFRAEVARQQFEAAQREEQLRREYEAKIAAERAQQSALQERLAEVERRSTGQAPPPRLAPENPLPPSSFAPAQPARSSVSSPGFLPSATGAPTYVPAPAAPNQEVAPNRTSGIAIAAFVLSICNFIPFVNFVAWIVAIILGHIALSQTERDPTLGGRRFAIAGLIITYSVLAIGLIAFLIFSVLYGFNLNRLQHQ